MRNVPSLYIHIPFCQSKCFYCDFASGIPPRADAIDAYIDAIVRELSRYERHKLDTVYLGGGTPSLLPPRAMEKLCGAIRDKFDTGSVIEWTIEANPNDVTPELARVWKDCGANRASLGIQNMNPGVLKFLGRRNTPEDNVRAVDNLRAAGFDNVSVDWILSIDGRDSGMKEFIGCFEPEHVSAYILSVEEGTPLRELVRAGKFSPQDDEESLRQYREAIDFLASAGYIHYEVSNFARGGKFRSRHNSHYWDYGEYLGAGMAAAGFRLNEPGAESFARRRTNTPDFGKYLAGEVAHSEDIDLVTAKREFVMLGLRKLEGFAAEDYERLFGEGSFFIRGEGDVPGNLKKFLTFDEARLKTTRAGVEILNTVIGELWELIE